MTQTATAQPGAPVVEPPAADLTTSISTSRNFFVKLWNLATPYFWSEERWFALGALGAVLAMNFFLVYIAKVFNEWNRDFFNALQEKNAAQFWKLLISFDSPLDFAFSWVGIVTIALVVSVFRTWLRLLLTIRWRRWLTEVYYADWLSDRTYYHMELKNNSTDNPEQRIEQDIGNFTQSTLTIGLGLISEIATLITFTIILWNLSGNMVLFGLDIPGMVLWIAVLYALAGSLATWFIGRRLIGINFLLERFNADFRYRLIRVRENAESIALYAGERDEQEKLGQAFHRIYVTWWDYIQVNLRLSVLNVIYSYAASIFPIVIQAPRYFAGEIQLGVLTQTAGAFGNVQSSLSWFVDSWQALADYKATTDRLTTFNDAIRKTRIEVGGADRFTRTADGDALELRDVRVALPDGRVLLDGVNLTVRRGDRIVLQGPSGSGKTTLFRVLAGIWPFGEGRIHTPAAQRVLFLPQKPYLPIGTLREALCYPDLPADHPEHELREALEVTRLAHLADRLEDQEPWSMILSPGEQQRLSFARAILVRPDWLFLDEASSALDEPTEAAMYQLLRERLPDATLVSIAHKPSVRAFHDRRLRLDPQRHTVTLEDLPEPPPAPAA